MALIRRANDEISMAAQKTMEVGSAAAVCVCLLVPPQCFTSAVGRGLGQRCSCACLRAGATAVVF